MSSVTAALKKLRKTRAHLEQIDAEAEANAKTEQEALDIFLRHGVDAETAAMFAGMHGERLAAQQAEKQEKRAA